MSVHAVTYFLFQDSQDSQWVQSSEDLAIPTLSEEGQLENSYVLFLIIFYLQYMEAEVEEMDLRGVCLLNRWSHGLTLNVLPEGSMPEDPTSPFWGDHAHCHAPDLVLRSAENLSSAIAADHPALRELVESCAENNRCTLPEARTLILAELTRLKEAARFAAAQGGLLMSMMAG